MVLRREDVLGNNNKTEVEKSISTMIDLVKFKYDIVDSASVEDLIYLINKEFDISLSKDDMLNNYMDMRELETVNNKVKYDYK